MDETEHVEYIMQQEVVDWEKVGDCIQVPKTKLTEAILPDGLKHEFKVSKSEWETLGYLSTRLMQMQKSDNEQYVNHSRFYNNMTENWTCIIYYY